MLIFEQVSTWFANARRRLKKENKMTWEPRNRCDYNDDDGANSDMEDNDTEDTLSEKAIDQNTHLFEAVKSQSDDKKPITGK